MSLRALASINLAAIERNAALLARSVAPARLCAVVKADGYGHGAAQAARAALRGGADRLAVATAAEAAALRSAGIEVGILVMGAISAEELPLALDAQAELVAWSDDFVAAARSAPLHVKLDTGMGRLGTRDVDGALGVARRCRHLAGAMTHFATADEDLRFVHEQLERFRQFLAELSDRSDDLVAHAANSAAALRVPESHFDMVRCGIAIYGCDPINQDASAFGLEPALALTSYIAAVKRAAPGDSAGYGRRFVADRETWLATLPIGYGDGFRRAFSNNCDVLVDGRRYPLVGTVSMDNITIDLGPESAVRVGQEATLIGPGQTAEELARRIGTISYEITCGLTARIPRVYHYDGEPV